MSRLQKQYMDEIRPALQTELGLKNVHEVPRLQKIVVVTGVGKYKDDKKMLPEISKLLSIITGQKPAERKAKKAISNFKLREGQTVGYQVTLRGARMYDFLDRFVSVAAPAIRDFRGFSRKSFDKQGNYTFGIKEHTVFPEARDTMVDTQIGLQFTLTIDSAGKEYSEKLLEKFHFPLVKE